MNKRKRRNWPWEDMETGFQAKGAACAKAVRWGLAEAVSLEESEGCRLSERGQESRARSLSFRH